MPAQHSGAADAGQGSFFHGAWSPPPMEQSWWGLMLEVSSAGQVAPPCTATIRGGSHSLLLSIIP